MKTIQWSDTLSQRERGAVLVFSAWLWLSMHADGVNAAGTAAPASSPPVVCISPFPYDKTAAAAETASRMSAENGNLHMVHLDNGIPWEAALAGSPFPAELMQEWEQHRRTIALGTNPVYLATAPLAKDRTSWAPVFGQRKAPAWARNEARASDELKKAYAQFLLRAIDYFHPAYLNLGIEAGDLAARKPEKWPLFEELFSSCAAQIRARHPSLPLGISFSLPFLMKGGVLERSQSLIDQSDYVGISFYPFMSEFYAKLGAPPLPAPPDQWRQPLQWLRNRVTKPVAMCETAYSSQPLALPRYNLNLRGSPEWQGQYVAELAGIARTNRYLFTAFFLCVDYEALLERMPEGDGSAGLWKNTGFFDRHLQAKPAWAIYQRSWRGRESAASPAPAIARPPAERPQAASSPLAFNSAADLFTAPSPDEVRLVQTQDRPPAMRWKYSLRKGEFSWATKEVPRGVGTGSTGLAFDLKSDRRESLLLQVEESNGEAFYCVLQPASGWTRIELPWSKFEVDQKKRRNGRLEPDQITRLLLADATAVDSKISGSRTVELTSPGFLRPEKK